MIIHWPHVVGPLLLVYILYRWPYELKVSWKHVGIFLKIEAVGTFLRFLFAYFFPQFFPKALIVVGRHLKLSDFLSVYWEEGFYVLPIVLLDKYIQPRWIIYLLLFFSAIMFGMGHLYQGVLAVIAMAIYAICCFVFRRSIGIGTFIICHIIHDLAVAVQIKLMF